MRTALSSAREVILTEAKGLQALAEELTEDFSKAVGLLKACTGRVIFSGMGKSGHIAAKIAATMASTGTPAFAVHPGEASHGDLGMIADTDVLVLISNSGNSRELKDVIAHGRRQGLSIIGITKNRESDVGRAATVTLVLPDVEEACALRLAPTTSTTMTLALGDALAVTLMTEKGFEPADFHRFHPGGKLGLDLILVRELMRPASAVPSIQLDAPMIEVLQAMNAGGLGLIALMNADTSLAGIITDGDVRRASQAPLVAQRPQDLMSVQPVSVQDQDLAVEALRIMNDRHITALIVRDEDAAFIGLLHIHELLRAGLA